MARKGYGGKELIRLVMIQLLLTSILIAQAKTLCAISDWHAGASIFQHCDYWAAGWKPSTQSF